MQLHQARVIEERDDLEDRLQEMKDFCRSSTFKTLDAKEKDLLIQQCLAMETCYHVLNQRIANFKR